ncbi:hypothetical protein PS6_001703 [Mucor atramentarius]
MELSTSEWKRKKPPTAKCLQQQAKNIRINKAILRHFLDLPISETDKNKAMALDMDWTGLEHRRRVSSSFTRGLTQFLALDAMV